MQKNIISFLEFGELLSKGRLKNVDTILDPKLIGNLIGELSGKHDIEYLVEVYADTHDVYCGSDYTVNGCINFFSKNRESLVMLASHLANEVNSQSPAHYLYNTMEYDCDIVNIKKVLANGDKADINDPDDESLYIVSEWLFRAALMQIMDSYIEAANSHRIC